MVYTCSAPPPAPQQGLFRASERTHGRNYPTCTGPASAPGNVRVWVEVRVTNQIWREDPAGGICSVPSNRLVYPFDDMLTSVFDMSRSVLDQLYDRQRWYGIVEVVLNAFGIEYRVERHRDRDTTLEIDRGVKLFKGFV
ncbi:hypothetical protein SELMODRAFT_418368 [Selaginella moellendorffii]|uniref:Uncharacterized protein n=1 Tax=Selaginella moellendorffii TaxID=88036 RepID=D8S5H6_SELML|nr:hypothetical protein SELMODRAFT_418368 [Selaginella moellendorffii]